MYLSELLILDSCPHCGINNPTIQLVSGIHQTSSNEGHIHRWAAYACKKCGLPITACTNSQTSDWVAEVYPRAETVDAVIPDRPREYLKQALLSLATPSGCVMLCASSVDAMLKDRGYIKGTLYRRIDSAQADHLLTSEMGKWAHQIRLDANDERHADESGDLPDIDDAKNAIRFTQALAEYLYVLPSKISIGISNAGQEASIARSPSAS
jgi:hypothetical protein